MNVRDSSISLGFIKFENNLLLIDTSLTISFEVLWSTYTTIVWKKMCCHFFALTLTFMMQLKRKRAYNQTVHQVTLLQEIWSEVVVATPMSQYDGIVGGSNRAERQRLAFIQQWSRICM
mgnify:CR=1 FL=1